MKYIDLGHLYLHVRPFAVFYNSDVSKMDNPKSTY